MIDQLTREDFAQLPPASLGIEYQGHRLALDVVETRELPAGSPRASPFAVVVAGPPSPVLPQGTYALLHPAHGRLDLFLVPIGRDTVGTRYEIIFN